MTDSTIIAGLGAVVLAVVGVVWALMRGEISEFKRDMADLKKENARLTAEDARLTAEYARSEERDKAFEAGITRLTKAIDDFDVRIGAQIERLSAVVQGATRRLSPSPRSYFGAPIKREDDK